MRNYKLYCMTWSDTAVGTFYHQTELSELSAILAEFQDQMRNIREARKRSGGISPQILDENGNVPVLRIFDITDSLHPKLVLEQKYKSHIEWHTQNNTLTQ